MQRELYNMYSPRFYAMCRRYTQDLPTADEALTEGFIIVFRDIDSFRGDGSFEGWMHTIFMRQIVRIYKRDKKHYVRSIDDVSPDEAVETVTVEDHDKAIDLRTALEECLKKLDDQQRLVFSLVAVDDYSITDAAKILEMNLSTFKSQYYQAKERLKKLLTRRLGKKYITTLL